MICDKNQCLFSVACLRRPVLKAKNRSCDKARANVLLVKNVPYAVRWCMSAIRWKGYKYSVEKFPESLGSGMENDSTKPKQLQKLNRSKRGGGIIVLKKEYVRKRGFLVIKGACCSCEGGRLMLNC